ncbi:MAG: metallophosphoesterase family protein, partial [Planctomycetota bacterium]|nr:metallophosphoesterase family protein [Planctomycetota bacterium]
MIAILSDIHGNLEALDAVLCDIGKQSVDSIYCLGDLVGYGPDPLPCIEIAMNWQIVLQGHCDKASLGSDDLPGFAPARHARQTILRFREQLRSHPKRDAISRFMMDRPQQFADAGAQFVHGTLRDSLNEYLFPESIYDHTKINAIGQLVETMCFCGHSHIAGIFSCDHENNWDYLPQNEISGHYPVQNSKTICNVGSV